MDVTVAQAGTEVNCQCGRVVSVPLLSKLRQLSGQEAYETGTIDTINRMIRTGELPWGRNVRDFGDANVGFLQSVCAMRIEVEEGTGRREIFVCSSHDYLTAVLDHLGH